MVPIKDISGLRFGNLVAKSIHSTSRNRQVRWTCQCDCGQIKDVLSTHLVSGKIISCGCARGKGKDHKNWKGYEGISGQFWSQLIRNANGTKGRRKIPLEITIEYVWDLIVEQDFKCSLSGLPLVIGAKHSIRGNASLDRINSEYGYVEGNVQWVHKDINKMKNCFSQDYFVEMCRAVSNSCELIDVGGTSEQESVSV